MGKAEDLERIRTRILDELHDELREEATNLVFGKGSCDAPILFIGEAPGAQEDLQGVPFVGRSGQELDKLLQGIGLTLDSCYIANILKYRPPKNRDPKPFEMEAHTPYLIEQIKVIQPQVICTLGNFSTKFVLGGFSVKGMRKVSGITALHGAVQEVEFAGSTLRVVPLYHPAAMLYRPQLRSVLAEDFEKLKELL